MTEETGDGNNDKEEEVGEEESVNFHDVVINSFLDKSYDYGSHWNNVLTSGQLHNERLEQRFQYEFHLDFCCVLYI